LQIKKEKYIAKWPDSNNIIQWTDIENQTWQTLSERQHVTIKDRACDEFIVGLQELDMPTNRVPQLQDLNKKLAKTSWEMVAVAGTVYVDEFFTMLKNRKFPVANFIRVPEELDYLSQPDVFHEYFGHGPLLMNQQYADFIQWYGEMALKLSKKQRQRFSRFFWYTIEFGLVNTTSGLRVLGAGILSSHKETISSLGESPSEIPAYAPFDLKETLTREYDYTVVQDKYFVLDGIDQLYNLRDSANTIKMITSDELDSPDLSDLDLSGFC